VRLCPLDTSATNWLIVSVPDDRWWLMWSSRWNENWQEKPKYSEKTCPSAILSTTNPTWLTWVRTRAAAVGSRRLIAWAMALPHPWLTSQTLKSFRLPPLPDFGPEWYKSRPFNVPYKVDEYMWTQTRTNRSRLFFISVYLSPVNFRLNLCRIVVQGTLLEYIKQNV
jgi:hypothetical protein